MLKNPGRSEEAKEVLDAAIAEYREALRLKADNPAAHFDLGIVLDKQGKPDAAIAEYREALRLKADYHGPRQSRRRPR